MARAARALRDRKEAVIVENGSLQRFTALENVVQISS
jgi:hypothetical protein